MNSAQGGLTNDQIKPIFTNLIGDNVVGIFSTIATKNVGFIPFRQATTDSLRLSGLTRNLNFAGVSTK